MTMKNAPPCPCAVMPLKAAIAPGNNPIPALAAVLDPCGGGAWNWNPVGAKRMGRRFPSPTTFEGSRRRDDSVSFDSESSHIRPMMYTSSCLRSVRRFGQHWCSESGERLYLCRHVRVCEFVKSVVFFDVRPELVYPPVQS